MLTILLLEPKGFCAGVSRAVKSLEQITETYKNKTIYVLHEIVHNDYILNKFRKLGVIFTENINTIPDNSILFFSAHGVSWEIEQIAKIKNLHTIDATCPLVKKTHQKIIQNEKQNKHTILIGSKNHAEIVGTSGRINKKNVTIIKNYKDPNLTEIPRNKPLSYIAQTTLSIDDTINTIDKLKKKFPDIAGLEINDICYATQNRQNAVKTLSMHDTELLLVIGAKNSSNSNKLCETGIRNNIPSYLISNHLEIQQEWINNIKKIAITAGASTPDNLINDVINYLTKIKHPVTIQNIVTKKESVKFKLPKIPETI